jgi:hypothetical protein
MTLKMGTPHGENTKNYMRKIKAVNYILFTQNEEIKVIELPYVGGEVRKKLG